MGNLEAPELLSSEDPLSNSFAVSNNGHIAILCRDGRIQYGNLRTREEGSNVQLKELALTGILQEDICVYSTVEFDVEGALLLLWSRTSVGIIELPATPHQADERCQFTEIFNVESNINSMSTCPIVKVCFHSLCNHQVVILQEKECLQLVDLRSMEASSIALPSDRKFTSFCFGPEMDWLRFTILLISEKGEVFSLCPIIPAGCVVSLMHVAELWDWVDQVEYENQYGCATIELYTHVLRTYLMEQFGERPRVDQLPAFVRAGEHGMGSAVDGRNGTAAQRNVIASAAAAVAMSNYSPLLRGPVPIERPLSITSMARAGGGAGGSVDDEEEEEEEEEEGRASGITAAGESKRDRITATTATTSNTASSIRHASKDFATDICVLGRNPQACAGTAGSVSTSSVSRGEAGTRSVGDDNSASPVLAISYRTGEVEFLVLDTPQSTNNTTTTSSSAFAQQAEYPTGAVDSAEGVPVGLPASAMVVRTDASASLFIGPSWRSMDRTQPHLFCSQMSLLVAETVQLEHSSCPTTNSDATAMRSSDNDSLFYWRLTPDPVFSHQVHITNPLQGRSYLLSCTWLNGCLAALQEQQMIEGDLSIHGGGGGGDGSSLSGQRYAELQHQREVDLMAEERGGVDGSYGHDGYRDAIDPSVNPSTVIPVFVLPPVSSSPSSPVPSNRATSSKAEASQESKFGGAGNSGNEGTSSQTIAAAAAAAAAAAPISGIVVMNDAMLGHVALIRTANGLASAVNLKVHLKLCELQRSLREHGGATAGAVKPIKAALGKATSAEELRWRHAQSRIAMVAQGLRDMPVFDAATVASLTPQPSSQNKKCLLEAAQKLERQVLVPLGELAQSTQFSFEMLQETYASQLEILQGAATSEGSEGGGGLGEELGEEGAAAKSVDSSDEEPPSLDAGLVKLIAHLNLQQSRLSARVVAIQRRFETQRSKAEAQLSFSISQRAKMSKAEHLYKRQLEEWSRVVSRMNEQVTALRQLSRCPASTPVAPVAAVDSTSTSTSSTVATSASVMSPVGGGMRSPFTPVATATTPQHLRPQQQQQQQQQPRGQPPLFSTSMSGIKAASSSHSTPTGGGGGGGGANFGLSPAAALGSAAVIGYSPAAAVSQQFRSPVKAGSTPGGRVLSAQQSKFAHLYAGGGRSSSTGVASGTGGNVFSTPTSEQAKGLRGSSSIGGSSVRASPSLYASYRSARSTSSTAGGTGGGFGTPAAAAAAGSTTTAAGTGRTPGGGAAMPTPSEPLQLSDADQEACNELLLSQTDLLAKAEQRLTALESQLQQLKSVQRL